MFQNQAGDWCGSVSFGQVDGKRIRKTVYGKTRKAVQTKLNQIQIDKIVPSKLTVSEFLAKWMADVISQRAWKTQQTYEAAIRLRLNPKIGGIKLTDLSPLHLHGFNRMTYAILHAGLQQAVKWQLIVRNPCVDWPKQVQKEVQVLAPAELEALLAAAVADRLYALYVLAAATGMRLGELFGLQWEDIDFAGSVQVRHTLEETGKLKEPKSAKGKRKIDLPGFAIDALHEHRKLMLAEGNREFVFCRPNGLPLEKGTFTRQFKRLLRRAGLPAVKFHSLRHSHASLLLAMGTDVKTVQTRLGHARASMTLDIYGHVLPGMQREVAARLDQVFAKHG